MKTKKLARALKKKIPKSPTARPGDIAHLQAWLAKHVTEAREDGIKLGMGVDTAETIRSLILDSNEARRLLQHAIDADHGEMAVDKITTFLATVSPRMAMKPLPPAVDELVSTQQSATQSPVLLDTQSSTSSH